MPKETELTLENVTKQMERMESLSNQTLIMKSLAVILGRIDNPNAYTCALAQVINAYSERRQ